MGLPRPQVPSSENFLQTREGKKQGFVGLGGFFWQAKAPVAEHRQF